jgi:hypothetical protein
MERDDRLASTRAARDPEWPAQHPALDAELVATIRGPLVDAEFDRQVWARIRAEAAPGALEPSPKRQLLLGPPLWLSVLNAIAIAFIVVALALALRMALQPAASSVGAAVALVEHSPTLMRMVAVAASATGLWLGLRRTPITRAIARQWL